MKNNLLLVLLLSFLVVLTNGCKEEEETIPEPSTQAAFSYSSDNSFTAPTTVSFVNQSVNALSYNWDFGNGQTSTGENPSVLYEEGGTYTVTLTVEPVQNLHYNELTATANIFIESLSAGRIKTLYFTSRSTGKVHYIKLDTLAPVVFDFPTGGFNKPYGIAIDRANKKVYVTDTDGFIYRYDLNGDNQEVVMSFDQEPTLTSPYGIVVVEEKIYWAQEGGIYMANLDGSNAEAFAEFAAAPELPLGMAYDSISQKIYFVNDKYDFSGGVWTINMDATGLTEIISGVDAGAITLDLLNGKLYYIDWIGGVFMANLDGSEVVNINPALDQLFQWGIAVDPDAGYLYVPDKENYKIIRSDLDGSNAEDWIVFDDLRPYATVIY
jgi:DNA-binding beta-propeller fold protein YncE